MVSTANATPEPQRLLHELISDVEFQRLEIILRKFNLFDALNLVWHEIRHSDFLAYLLDPQQNHGLRDMFLKAFLRETLKGVTEGVTPIDIDVWNLSGAAVVREWQNIDILIRDEANRFVVLIENKVNSGEHDNQLVRYYKCVEQEYQGWNVVAVYLTLEKEDPSDERYAPLGYDQVCQVLQNVSALLEGTLNPDVRLMLEHYADMLRRHILSDSDVFKLCSRIYSKHKQALDLIFEHRPDRLLRAKEILEAVILTDSRLTLDHCTKSYIRFIPAALDTPALKQGSGYTPTGRILLFEVENFDTGMAVKLLICPGPSAIREKLFEITKQKPFSGAPLLYPRYTTVYRHRILGKSTYALEDDATFADTVKNEWNKFVTND